MKPVWAWAWAGPGPEPRPRGHHNGIGIDLENRNAKAVEMRGPGSLIGEDPVGMFAKLAIPLRFRLTADTFAPITCRHCR